LSDKFTAIPIKQKENPLLAESNDCSTEVPIQVFSMQLRPVSSSKPDEAKPDTVDRHGYYYVHIQVIVA
jgi:hypothetical protein